MEGVMTYDQAMKFLSTDELKERASSAFTEVPSSIAKDRYQLISTPEVITKLAAFGWKPVAASQMRAKLEKNEGFQRHYIRLRHKDLWIGTKDSIELLPELVIMNSYSARCSFQLHMGMYRPVCGNEFIFDSELLPKMRTCHNHAINEETGRFKIDEFDEDLNKMAHAAHKMCIIVDRMKKVNLQREQQREFAKEAITARWDYTRPKTGYEELLKPLRFEDEGNDLWIVFNRVQEKILKGEWTGPGGRAIKPLTNPDRALKTNARLYVTAEDFLMKYGKKDF